MVNNIKNILVTPKCIQCGIPSEVEITDDEFEAYIINREFAQKAFPTRSADFRELLISGTHAVCWDAIFKTPDCDNPGPDCKVHNGACD